MKTLLELFAGGGMARRGFGPSWTCVFANDIDPKKRDAYIANFGHDHFLLLDVKDVTIGDLPAGCADCAWMSPPCVGHSEAGNRKGFDDEQSSAFWPAWEKIEALDARNGAPLTTAFENAPGIKPENLAAVQAAFGRAHYRHATRMADAQHFVPQSRKRYFVVGAHRDLGVDPEPLFEHAMRALPERNIDLTDVLDLDAENCLWEFSPAEVERCLAMMSPLQRRRFETVLARGRPIPKPFSKRMRGPKGNRVQRVEFREGLASALRVASNGGSSKQFLIIAHGNKIRMRAIQGREAARLMGLPDSYVLPAKPIEALDLCGDGVCVPVVRFLVERVIEPLLRMSARPDEARRQGWL
jgi:DNA (cytosine-5)-methyltransferase 1